MTHEKIIDLTNEFSNEDLVHFINAVANRMVVMNGNSQCEVKGAFLNGACVQLYHDEDEICEFLDEVEKQPTSAS